MKYRAEITTKMSALGQVVAFDIFYELQQQYRLFMNTDIVKVVYNVLGPRFELPFADFNAFGDLPAQLIIFPLDSGYRPQYATLEEVQRHSYSLLHSGASDSGAGCFVADNQALPRLAIGRVSEGKCEQALTCYVLSSDIPQSYQWQLSASVISGFHLRNKETVPVHWK